jgi:hypothetical protein
MPAPEPSDLRAAVSAYATVAAAYEAGRPSYPPDAVAWVVAEASIGPGRDILDLAAGTGKLTRLLFEKAAEEVRWRAVLLGRRGRLVSFGRCAAWFLVLVRPGWR